MKHYFVHATTVQGQWDKGDWGYALRNRGEGILDFEMLVIPGLPNQASPAAVIARVEALRNRPVNANDYIPTI